MICNRPTAGNVNMSCKWLYNSEEIYSQFSDIQLSIDILDIGIYRYL